MTLVVRTLQKIVRNNAMHDDPPQIYGWRVFLVTCSACFGAMCFGWDSSVIGGVIVMDPFIQDYHLGTSKSSATANIQANIVSTLQAGCFVGALAASPITDSLGRKWPLIFGALVILSGVVMQSAAQGNLGILYAGRFIGGLGVGAASTINPIYVSENAPRAIRGLLTGLYQLFNVTGGMIAFWINYLSKIHFSGKTQYLFPLTIQALPGVLLCLFMLCCHESPRWLARQDRWNDAKRVLSRVRNLPPTHPFIAAELGDIAAQLQCERHLLGSSTPLSLQRDMWLVATNRRRALVCISLMVCQQMTGTNAINVYAPIIFRDLGLPSTSQTLFSTGIYGIVKTVSCLAFVLFLADSLGRRRSLLWTSVAQGCAMFYIGLNIRFNSSRDGEGVSLAGYVAIACIFLFAAAFQVGWGPTCWIYASEIPTARLRSLNVAYASATQWLFNFAVARSVPAMLITVGSPNGYGTYLIFGSFCFSMFFFVWFYVPETKGISLESMDALFGARPQRGGEKSSPSFTRPVPVDDGATKSEKQSDNTKHQIVPSGDS